MNTAISVHAILTSRLDTRLEPRPEPLAEPRDFNACILQIIIQQCAFFVWVLCRTNMVKVIRQLSILLVEEDLRGISIIISGTNRHLSRTTNIHKLAG